MHYTEVAIAKLLSTNYKLYLPIQFNSYDIVVVIKNEPKRCLIRTTKNTAKGPTIVLESKKVEFDFTKFDYVIPVEVMVGRVWLVPVSHIDPTKKTMMLSAFANDYLLVPQTSNIARVVKKQHDIKIAQLTEKTANRQINESSSEDILNLLERDSK